MREHFGLVWGYSFQSLMAESRNNRTWSDWSSASENPCVFDSIPRKLFQGSPQASCCFCNSPCFLYVHIHSCNNSYWKKKLWIWKRVRGNLWVCREERVKGNDIILISRKYKGNNFKILITEHFILMLTL